MSASKNINAYRDIHELFLLGMERGKIELEFLTVQEAYREVIRFNAYRRLLRDRAASVGLEPACEFDGILVRHLKGADGKPGLSIALESRKSTTLRIRDANTGEELKLAQTPTVLPQAGSADEEEFLQSALAARAPLLKR